MSDLLRDAATGPLAAELPVRFMEQHALLPLQVASDGALEVAAARPLDATVTDLLQRRFGHPVRLVEATLNDLQAALLAARRDPDPATRLVTDEASLGDLRAQADDAPVVQLVNAAIADALRRGASDIHFEGAGDGLRVRLREDGVLRELARYPATLVAGALSRVKLLAGLDIAERRLPQDGRARVRLAGHEVDLRVATLPSLHGESAVLRVLDHAGGQARSLDALGMPADVRERLGGILRRTSGLVLATGPTGSGKTTTLYAALSYLNVPGVKVVSVEDPVEYELPGVTQVPVNRKAGLGFAQALRSILRHDPDIVMVGEMRDRETAEVAVQAALTGHLVFSTLHTNDAASGVTRLVDMGIEPYLVAATVQAILAQRLVRVLCPECSSGGTPVGCEACRQSGYRGRAGLYELLVPDESFRRGIVDRLPLAELRTMARKAGARSLAEAGDALVSGGRTTRAEVLRVTEGSDA